jgi:hypothetical protein
MTAAGRPAHRAVFVFELRAKVDTVGRGGKATTAGRDTKLPPVVSGVTADGEVGIAA